MRVDPSLKDIAGEGRDTSTRNEEEDDDDGLGNIPDDTEDEEDGGHRHIPLGYGGATFLVAVGLLGFVL